MFSRAGGRSSRLLASVVCVAGLSAAACGRSVHAPWAHYPLPDTTRRQINRATEVAGLHRTHAEARRRGFSRIAPDRITDLNPFQGEHWINDRAIRLPFDPTRPGYVMYYPLGDDPQVLVGVAYAQLVPTGSSSPDGFHGDADRWHVHLPCYEVPGLGYVLAFSEAGCRALQGRPGPMQIAMVHVWTGVASPDGPFAMNNPTLPFLASGLTPPDDAAFHDPDRSPLLREVALALGETFGAVPRLGASIAQHPDSTFADAVRPMRDSIRALLPALDEAQGSGDGTRFDEVAHDKIAQWRLIRDAYLDAAGSREHRMMLDQWFRAVTAHPENGDHD